MADRIGRRKTVVLAAVLFTVGAAVEAVAPGTGILVIGRLVVGFGVGVASVAAPLYAAEMAPTRLRGTFMSMYQLAITVGIFLAYLVDGWLASEDRWRLMLGMSAIPALLLVLAMLPLPDSPNWYLKVGEDEKAVSPAPSTCSPSCAWCRSSSSGSRNPRPTGVRWPRSRRCGSARPLGPGKEHEHG